MDLDEKWVKIFIGTLIFNIIMFFITINQEDTAFTVCFILMLLGIIATIITVIKINVDNAGSKGMSAGEYLSDRFENAIPETKELLGSKGNSNILVKCPYCQSTNTKKISNFSKAASVAAWGVYAMGKVSKEWHCNNCNSNF